MDMHSLENLLFVSHIVKLILVYPKTWKKPVIFTKNKKMSKIILQTYQIDISAFLSFCIQL